MNNKICQSTVVSFLGLVAIPAQGQQAKHRFLFFWRSDCGVCEAAIQQLVAKCASLNQDSFSITAVSLDTDSISYYKAIKENRMVGFEYRYDFQAGFTHNLLAKKYRVTKTPTFLYLDVKGEINASGQEAFTKLSSFKKVK